MELRAIACVAFAPNSGGRKEGRLKLSLTAPPEESAEAHRRDNDHGERGSGRFGRVRVIGGTSGDVVVVDVAAKGANCNRPRLLGGA